MTRTLLVHIGTGKTGSTAIQRALAASAKRMRCEKVDYWGINLERCPQPSLIYPWQKPSGVSILQKLDPAEALCQLQVVLESSLGQLPDGHMAIWSNESIYERPSVFIPAIMDTCEKLHVNPVIICYVRNHRSYVASAYHQWGVKHKTYPGRIKGFSDWVISNVSFLSYAKKIAAWDEVCSERLILVNYDNISDVVESFSSFLSNPEILRLPSSRLNETLPPGLLALFALINNQTDSPVTPSQVESLLRRYPLEASKHEILDLASIFPCSSELDAAEELLQDDAKLINDLLLARGQLKLRSSQSGNTKEAKTSDIHSSLVSIMCKILMVQDARISKLEAQVAGGYDNEG